MFCNIADVVIRSFCVSIVPVDYLLVLCLHLSGGFLSVSNISE